VSRPEDNGEAPLDTPALLGHLAGFLGGSLVVVGSVVAVLVLLVSIQVPVDSPGFDASFEAATEDPRYIGPATFVQGIGLALLAILLGRRLPRAEGQGLAWVLGLRSASLVFVLTALLGGLLVWIWPSWFAARLIDWTGLESSVVSIGELLTGPLDEIGAMVAAVVIAAPLAEELLFRGYLWRLVEDASGSGRIAFVLTTLLFALYHMDPIHVLALLPTAAFLGWLRWTSGSLWPAILAHFVNNLAAVVVVRVLPEDSLGPVPSFVGGGLFVAVVLIGWRLSRASGAPGAPTRR